MRIGRLPAADETGLRGDELEMRLVTQAPGLRDRELALVDGPGCEVCPGCWGEWRSNRVSALEPAALAANLRGDLIPAPAVVARWPWDRRGVVGMKADPGRIDRDCRCDW